MMMPLGFVRTVGLQILHVSSDIPDITMEGSLVFRHVTEVGPQGLAISFDRCRSGIGR
jgi:hypothetical protein